MRPQICSNKASSFTIVFIRFIKKSIRLKYFVLARQLKCCFLTNTLNIDERATVKLLVPLWRYVFPRLLHRAVIAGVWDTRNTPAKENQEEL